MEKSLFNHLSLIIVSSLPGFDNLFYDSTHGVKLLMITHIFFVRNSGLIAT